MEGTLTSFLSLTKPNFQGSADIRVINTDLDTIDAAASRNLLVNPGLEIWQRGAGPFTLNNAYAADRWQIQLGGASTMSVSRDAGNAATGSQYAAAAVYVQSATSQLGQKIEDYLQLRGRTITFAADVKASVAGAARLAVYDGATRSYGAYHSGGGSYERLSVTVAVPTNATQVQVELSLGASGTFYLDNATLHLGSAPVAYAPLNPHEDMARCLRYYREAAGLDASEYVLVAQAFSTTQAVGALAYPVEMAVAPTVTVSAASDFQLLNAAAGSLACTGLSASFVTRKSCRLLATVAAGLVAGNATALTALNTNARLRFEANP